MSSKANLYGLMFLLLVLQFVMGCSSTRRGLFLELGGGGGVVAAHERWGVRTYKTHYEDESVLESILSFDRPSHWYEEIGRTNHSQFVVKGGATANFRVGYGLSEKFLVLYSLNGLYGLKKRELLSGMFTLRRFTKKTAPSLFFDLVIPLSEYEFSEISASSIGLGAGLGVGYEFTNHCFVRANLNLGLHVSPEASGALLGGVFDRDVPNTTMSSAIGFTVGYLLY